MQPTFTPGERKGELGRGQQAGSAAKVEVTRGEGNSRDQLSVVMAFLGEQLAPPAQERPEGGVRILRNVTLIAVGPHLQAHQSDPDVQGSVELINIVGDLQELVLGGVQVVPILPELCVISHEVKFHILHRE